VYVLFLEVTLPELANTAALDALHHLERLFVGVAGVTSTQLLQNTEDPRVLLLQVSSRAELLQTVRQADLNLENVKTRVWGFTVLETPVVLPSA
jgi:hypothetical protein